MRLRSATLNNTGEIAPGTEQKRTNSWRNCGIYEKSLKYSAVYYKIEKSESKTRTAYFKEEIYMISAGDFRNGITIELEGNIYQIINSSMKPGKGAAFVRTKLKNIKISGMVEKDIPSYREMSDCPH